jgi:hypothetical protein
MRRSAIALRSPKHDLVDFELVFVTMRCTLELAVCGSSESQAPEFSVTQVGTLTYDVPHSPTLSTG